MKLDFNLQIKQKQGLTLTAQVQQAIKLLQMTNTEICEFVEEQFIDNPFVEDPRNEEATQSEQTNSNDAKSIDKAMEANPYERASEENKSSQENQFETGESYIPRSTVAKENRDFDAVSLIAEEQKSLFVHCIEFCSLLELTPPEHLIALRLIEELEPTGWISADLELVANELKVDAHLVEHVLFRLQRIEPAGIFARNLKECLELQAISNDIYCGSMKVILDNLHLIGSGKFDLLKRRSGCTEEVLSRLFRKIKSLDPKPGLKFDASQTAIREPDLFVKATPDGWIVELNNSTLPDVKISRDYAKILTTSVKEKSEREFIREKIGEAKWLQGAINKRNETMLKVGTEIIKKQVEFLEKGSQFIRPMILNDIAEAIGMHESTISRVTTGSLIQTPRGTLPLKAFFSIGIKQIAGDDAASASAIRFRIKKLVELEDPASPVSDEAIAAELSKNGIEVARRTIAKYRKIENIPSSFSRKRQNMMAGVIR